jgi:hypothetical protein
MVDFGAMREIQTGQYVHDTGKSCDLQLSLETGSFIAQFDR